MSHSQRTTITSPASPFYRGPFGRLFRTLEAWHPDQAGGPIDNQLLAIANERMLETPNDGTSDSNIPAGYTYFGQFVDHDITFDPASELMRQNDPSGLLNHRTPRLDLDNIYGSGRDVSPYLFDTRPAELSPSGKPEKLLIGEIQDAPKGLVLPDLPRNSQGRALIGDPRNDENSIVSQLQTAFLLAHNNLVDIARAQSASDAYETASRTLRWLYQHIVWNDFIKRITLEDIHCCALELNCECGGRQVWDAGLTDVFNWKNQPFMPVEFSVAAYRMGHSLVRNAYQTNNPITGFGNEIPLFDNDPESEDLRGFRPLPPGNAIQWDWFLPMKTSRGPFPQHTRPLDPKLSRALTFLPDEASPDNILAFRNLKRGLSFGLPSGTTVARRLGISPIELENGEPDALWYYVLREAELQGGNHLGHVGSTIVCATLAGLLKGDPYSFFNQAPRWTPQSDPLLKQIDNPEGTWDLASIIRVAKLKSDGLGRA